MELIKEYLKYANDTVTRIDKYVENIKGTDYVIVNTTTMEDYLKLIKYLKEKHNKSFCNFQKKWFYIFEDRTMIFIDKGEWLCYQSIDYILNKVSYHDNIFMQYENNKLTIYDNYKDMVNNIKGE